MYCVYKTTYLGERNLPRYYIGSTSLDKINSGYYGSVSSKKYKDAWSAEDRSLFNVDIIETFDNREDALKKELEIQQLLNVVADENYANMSYARPNGFFGMDVSGENNPMYGRSRKGEKHKGGENISKSLKEMYANTVHGKKLKEESRRRWKENNPSQDTVIMDRIKEVWKNKQRNVGEKNGMYGKSSPMRGKKLYNNGKETKAFLMGDQPSGWVLGRHKK